MIKYLLKIILGRLGYVVMRNHPRYVVEWIANVSQKINILEMLIKLELSKGKEFTFIQIGANDGKQADPLSELVKKYNLKGTLVEPIPEIFNQLKKNYASISQKLQFENIAITVEAGDHIPFYMFSSPDEERRLALSGYASTSKAKVQEVKLDCNIREEIKEVRVSCETVDVFIKKRNINAVSLLVTDVEGLDIEIVSSFIASSVYPEIIYMEILGQSIQKVDYIHRILVDNGYLIGGNISDLIAIKQL